MGELVYNLFVYATNNEIKALGVATHRIGGNDDEKIAHLQGAAGDDFRVATQYLLSKPLPWQQFESLMRLGRALELFESVLTEIHAQREPLVVITPVVDGAPRFDFVGGLRPQDMALVRARELGLDSVMVDYLEKYLTPNGFDLPRLINDDYFEAIRLLFNRSHYVSSAKLLMSCLDTLAFIEFGDIPQSFQKVAPLFC